MFYLRNKCYLSVILVNQATGTILIINAFRLVKTAAIPE